MGVTPINIFINEIPNIELTVFKEVLLLFKQQKYDIFQKT